MNEEPRFASMTADDFRAALERLEISQRGFARAAQVDERTVRKWVLGESPVPGLVALTIALLEALEKADHEKACRVLQEFGA